MVKNRGTTQYCTVHSQYSLCSLFLCRGKWTSDGIWGILSSSMQYVLSSLHSNYESPLLQSMFQSAKMFWNVIVKSLPTPFQNSFNLKSISNILLILTYGRDLMLNCFQRFRAKSWSPSKKRVWLLKQLNFWFMILAHVVYRPVKINDLIWQQKHKSCEYRVQLYIMLVGSDFLFKFSSFFRFLIRLSFLLNIDKK